MYKLEVAILCVFIANCLLCNWHVGESCILINIIGRGPNSYIVSKHSSLFAT